MTITISQSCNRCGKFRALNVGHSGGSRTIADASERGGWRVVREGAHLCAECITEVLKD